MSADDAETVYDILKNLGIYNKRDNNGLKSIRMNNALCELPKAKEKN